METNNGEDRTRVEVPVERARAGRIRLDRLLTERGVLDEQGKQTRPLTLDDVERLIAANWDTAEGLNLSERDLQGAKLSNAKLQGADLFGAELQRAKLFRAKLQGADLSGAHLQGADLSDACLQGAHLGGAELQGADLLGAELQGANLYRANLQGADLRGAHLQGALLSEAILATTLLPESHSGFLVSSKAWIGGCLAVPEEQAGQFAEAEPIYRNLKRAYTNAGMYDQAGELFRLEMRAHRRRYRYGESTRKKGWSALLAWPKETFPWLLSLLMHWSCGYGERPSWVLGWFATLLLGFTLLYWLAGNLTPGDFPNALYYSASSSTALGYGDWSPRVSGWAAALGPVQAALGMLAASLFLVTFVRKLTR